MSPAVGILGHGASVMKNYPPGWTLLGQYPLGDSDGVGSWILHQNGEAALVELPPDKQLAKDAEKAVAKLGVVVKYILVSHDHDDHFDEFVLARLRKKKDFRNAIWLEPRRDFQGQTLLDLAGEPLWLLHAPKHSRTDTVIIFRGVAMTGDIELGMIESVNKEVKRAQKIRSLAFLADFERASGYHIHTIVSAHLNDHREQIDWRSAVTAE